MNIVTPQRLLQHLGQSYSSLSQIAGLGLPALEEVHDGSDVVFATFNAGLSIAIWKPTDIIEKLSIVLRKDLVNTEQFDGPLPYDFHLLIDQSSVRAALGSPQSAPAKYPEPIGESGGWDCYPLSDPEQPNTEVVFRYAPSSLVQIITSR